MSSDDEKIIREIIDRYVHYKDWITLGAKLCFSGAFISTKVDFFKNNYYYKKLGQILDPSDSLRGLDLVKMDWKDLYNQYKNNNNVIFIFDPPHDNTINKTYRNQIIDLDELLERFTLPFFGPFTL